MKYLVIFLCLALLGGCVNPENTIECKQAHNKVVTYSESLDRLYELYNGEIDTEEAQRRITAMQGRISAAKYAVSVDCTR